MSDVTPDATLALRSKERLKKKCCKTIFQMEILRTECLCVLGGGTDALMCSSHPNPLRVYVSVRCCSSISISLDSSRCTSPMSSSSLTPPVSPNQRWEPTCPSPSPREGQSPVQNGHTEEVFGHARAFTRTRKTVSVSRDLILP